MRKYGYLSFDILVTSLMLILALYLRNGPVLIEDGRPGDIQIFLLAHIAICLCVLPLMGTHNRLWRYTSADDMIAILISVTLIVLLMNGVLFLFNRLEIVPRSVPPIHWALSVAILCGARVAARKFYGPAQQKIAPQKKRQHVLLVGTGQIGELYLDFTKKIIPGQIAVEGFLDENINLRRRNFHQYPILGQPKELPTVLEQFMVHGIQISQVVLAQPFESLSLESKQVLLELERKGVCELVDFGKQIGPTVFASDEEEAELRQHSGAQAASFYQPTGIYPAIKRFIDVLGASVLLLLTAPLMLLTAIMVALDVGLPILFWQQRPGRYGLTFRLYKFRTMRPARRRLDEDRLAHKEGDAKRTSVIGRWIRRLRLDELPQLLHIISGEMSFIGPRPLLPDDQPENGEIRLSVRPGITGWAQVNGGDALNAEQKLILDIWYIQHMSLWLDIRILCETFLVLFKKDTPKLAAVEAARKQIHWPKDNVAA